MPYSTTLSASELDGKKNSRDSIDVNSEGFKPTKSTIDDIWSRQEWNGRREQKVAAARSASRSRSRDREDTEAGKEKSRDDRTALRRRRHEREEEEGETDFDEMNGDLNVKRRRRAKAMAKFSARKDTKLAEEKEEEKSSDEHEESAAVTPLCDPVDDKHAFLSPSGQLLVAAMSIHGKRRHGEDGEGA